jgi:hypothetical protein
VAFLIVFDVDGDPHAVRLADRTAIGDLERYPVSLAWSGIREAVVERTGDRWQIRAGLNFLYVRGREVQAAVLAPGDEIRLGQIRMQFVERTELPTAERIQLDFRPTARTLLRLATALSPAPTAIEGHWVYDDDYQVWYFVLDARLANGAAKTLTAQLKDRAPELRDAAAAIAAQLGIPCQIDETRPPSQQQLRQQAMMGSWTWKPRLFLWKLGRLFRR